MSNELYTVCGSVMDGTFPRNNIESAKINFSGPTNVIVNCDKFGCYQAENLQVGDYTITAEAFGMEPEIREWALAPSDRENWYTAGHYVNFVLMTIPSGQKKHGQGTAIVDGKIVDGNGLGIGNAKITWSNADTSVWTFSTTFPIITGIYTKNLAAGIYDRTIEKSGFVTRVDHDMNYPDGIIHDGLLEISV